MPSGKVHDQITIVAAVVVAPIWWYFAPTHSPSETAILAASTLVSGLLFSPDLDLNSSIYHRWGPLRFIWWPYQKLIPHRSKLSHSFILGPLLRLVYFLGITWVLLRGLSWVVSLFIDFDRNGWSQRTSDVVVNAYHFYPRHFQVFLVGMFLGAGLHTGADLIVTAYKKRRHRRRRHG